MGVSNMKKFSTIFIVVIALSVPLNTFSNNHEKDVFISNTEKNMQVKTFFEEGNKNFNNKNYKKAVQCYGEVVKLNPYYVTPYINAGLAYKKMDKYKKAISVYDMGIKFNSKSYSLYVEKAGALYDMKKYTDALEVVEKGISINNKGRMLNHAKGAILAATGNHFKAIKYMNKELEINYREYSAHKDKFCSLMALGNFQEALATCDNAIKYGLNESDVYEVYANKAKVLYELQEYPEALESVNKAIAINPNYQEAQRIKCLIKTKLQNT